MNFGSLARAAALCLLALATTLLQSQEAQAQWTTSGTNSTTTNNVGVGTTAPTSNLHIVNSSTSVTRGITDEQTSADANSAMFTFKKSRAGAAAINGDNVGNVYAAGFDGTAFVSGARLRFAIDGTVSANNVPTAIQFHTGTGGNGGVERMRISSGGYVGIDSETPAAKLHVQ
ncbi:MAG TPA: hypothetical protein VF611_14435, partial [Pyrinomonadaceae bacterium]